MGSPRDAIAAARHTLVRSGVAAAEARVDAEVLARHVLGWDRARLLTNGRDPAPPNFQDAFDALLRRRGAREPVAQILGRREFWGLDFDLTPDVLIPRPETEILVEEAIDFAGGHPCRLVIDVGTGSGCIAVAVAHALPVTRVIAIDASLPALDVARRNVTNHDVADRITCRHGDVLAGVSETADLILSNPPYVPDADAATMQAEVVRFEPHAALFGGADGLDIMRRLMRQAPTRLASGGRLVVEFGFGQEAGVRALAGKSGWEILRIREDLQGIPRAAVLIRAATA
ncbi:MAG TPA: peptide chain release factor N(5)-glutamine methyltransferase [Vicinamibacterales bacterium]|nr:peptide chain release factor N(5)-glutamine methyltransferase [Vicinamibacterales bacterium]